METVIVVPGLWLPGLESWLLRRRLNAGGFRPVVCSLPAVSATLAANADALARFAAGQPGDRVHFVGHSLGGVVAAQMLATHRPPRSGRLVCLGSPLKGSHAGRRLARVRLGAAIVGSSVRELNDRGGLPAWQGPAELGIIAGSVGIGLGRLLGKLPQPSDGTVAVAETMLEGAKEHLILTETHFSLLASRRVADLTMTFLRSGHFRAPAGA